LDEINTNESARIVEIFSKEPEFKELQSEHRQLKSSVAKALGVSESLEPAALDNGILKAFNDLEEKNMALHQLHRTYSTEIQALQKLTASTSALPEDPGSAKRIAEAKKKAYEAIQLSGALS
jgi:hypothetical protein